MSDRQQTLFRERVSSTPLLGLAIVVTVTATLSAVAGQLLVAGIQFAAASTVAWFSIARYEVTTRELLVRVGPGFPRLRFVAAQIDSVELDSVAAWRSGGLGYRGSWTFGKRVIVSLGTAGGVRIRIHPRGSISLSSRRSDELVAAINDLVVAQRPPVGG